MKPKVLLLSTSLGMGGADRQILYLAHALLAQDHEVRLVSMTPLEEMGQRAIGEGLPITSLNMQRGRAEWGAFRRLVALLQDWRPHVLTSFMYHANLLGRLAGRWTRVPLIVTSIRSERNGTALRDRFMRVTNWMDDCRTTNSLEVASSLQERAVLPRGDVRVIPNGIDIESLTAAPEERARIRSAMGLSATEFLWLAIGRLTPQKDYPTLLEAFPCVAAGPARLWIAGRGPELPTLQQQVDRLGIASRVTFLGVRHDIAALLAAADGFVLSSGWEGMPNVVMEALAAGVPVVATRVGGVSELVADGSGFLVPAQDPGALAQAMRKLMSLPIDERRQMGSRGRDHVAAHYSLQSMADRWIALYRELLIKKELL